MSKYSVEQHLANLARQAPNWNPEEMKRRTLARLEAAKQAWQARTKMLASGPEFDAAEAKALAGVEKGKATLAGMVKMILAVMDMERNGPAQANGPATGGGAEDEQAGSGGPCAGGEDASAEVPASAGAAGVHSADRDGAPGAGEGEG